MLSVLYSYLLRQTRDKHLSAGYWMPWTARHDRRSQYCSACMQVWSVNSRSLSDRCMQVRDHDSEGIWKGFAKENSIRRRLNAASLIRKCPNHVKEGNYLPSIWLARQGYCVKGACTIDITDPSVHYRLLTYWNSQIYTSLKNYRLLPRIMKIEKSICTNTFPKKNKKNLCAV